MTMKEPPWFGEPPQTPRLDRDAYPLVRFYAEDNAAEGRVTRIEVIDENGRAYVRDQNAQVQLSYQDDGRTLKIFVSTRK